METRLNLYFYNIFKSGNLDFDINESFIISKLLSLRSTGEGKDEPLINASSNLLNLFKSGNVKSWQQVDRVCFVVRDSYSNQLRILSSASSEKVLETTLVPGYSCIVDEHSSLMNSKPGEIRIYDNIDLIINSFTKINKKVQRSLMLIHKSNLKSGLSIPLRVNGNILGFLFFNSLTPAAFSKLKNEDFTMLCLVQLMFQELLSDYFFEIMSPGLLSMLENTENRNQVSLISLEKDLEKIFYSQFKKDVNIFVDIHVDTYFLLTHRKFLMTVLVILKSIKNISACEKIYLDLFEIKDDQLFVSIKVDEGSAIVIDGDVKTIYLLEGVETVISKNKIVFAMKFEAITDKLLYSV